MAVKRLRSKTETTRAYWLYVLPAFILYLFVFAFPIIISVILSLSNYQGGTLFGGDSWKIIGFQQYVTLFHDPDFWLALKNNMYIVVISVFGQLPLGFILAYLIYRRIVKFGGFWEGTLYVPVIISVIVLGIMWKLIFAPDGVMANLVNYWNAKTFSAHLSQIFASAGGFNITDDVVKKILNIADPKVLQNFQNPVADLKDLITSSYNASQMSQLNTDLTNLLAPKWSADFLAKQDWAMIPIMFVTLWVWTGMYIILFHANMQKIDTQILEAAQIDGATEMQVMSKIVLPSLSGVIANAAILCIAGSLNTFALIWAMTAGGPMNVTNVLSIYMYQKAFVGSPNFPLANAISLAIVIFSFVLIGITLVIEKKFGGKED